MINVNKNSERDGIISDLLPDLTPLLDVMFMLIIFLVLTTNAMQQVFDISLPEDKDNVLEDLSEKDTIKVTIFSENNQWAINEKKFSDFALFKEELILTYHNTAKQQIIVFSDKSATVERLMDLLTFMRSKGIETTDIIMQ
jgi:biopolymer transport protein ExbD